MRIEIICTGDEVLTGKIVNTNFTYISQKLEDHGLSVKWETTVGDDREDLLQAFQAAGERADAVIVNGGLGPTVDDLSQEVAAQASGVELELHEGWLARMKEMFVRRGRTMSPNNVKQAMLPVGAELVDNPVGTACGFGVTIGKARFYFTPGVPRELRAMLEKEILPRLLQRGGGQAVILLKRFHSFGLGESHVDSLLDGVAILAPEGSVKLGFRAHYPQLETKLTVRGQDGADVAAKLAPVEREVRRRIGNFVLAEDDDTLEGVVLSLLTKRRASLAVAETLTGGQVAARLAALPGAETVFCRGTVACSGAKLAEALATAGAAEAGTMADVAASVAHAARRQSGATHGLAALVDMQTDADGREESGTITVAIATGDSLAARSSLLAGGRDWVRLGAIEMALDCLRRLLLGLPVNEKIDFEKAGM
jgi:nicotinamide-nucleotide amidase